MAYIDLDEINRLHPKLTAKYPLSFANGISVAVSEINRLPNADVVPKSEVERLSHKCEECAGCTQWKCDCANIELEVAREIFEEIDGITDLFAKGLIGELEMYDKLAELKKKYI